MGDRAVGLFTLCGINPGVIRVSSCGDDDPPLDEQPFADALVKTIVFEVEVQLTFDVGMPSQLHANGLLPSVETHVGGKANPLIKLCWGSNLKNFSVLACLCLRCA